MATESGLRSHVLMELRYRHVMEDLENGIIPVAVRLEPRVHVGKKAAGYTFLGPRSISLLRDCINEGIIDTRPEARLIPRSYYGIWAAIHRASRKVGLDPKIQTCHGLRKYFENALDDARVDHEKKMIIEGHFAGTRAQHYTDRDREQLRGVYRKACQFIDLRPEESRQVRSNYENQNRQLVRLETGLKRQRILEDRLIDLENQIRLMTPIRNSIPGAHKESLG